MLLALALTAHATDYTDLAAWQAAAGDVETYDFTDLAYGTSVSSSYSGYFYGFDDVVIDGAGYAPDTHVLYGGREISITLLVPAQAIAADFLDGVEFELYDAAGYLLYSSAWFGSPGAYGFAGVVFPDGFSSVKIKDWSDGYWAVNIDNLYVGRQAPTIDLSGSCPSAVSVVATGFPPHLLVAVLSSSGVGSAVIPSGACAGLQLGLSTVGLTLRTVQESNSDGEVIYNGPVRPARCNETYQFVDLAQCKVSNVDTF